MKKPPPVGDEPVRTECDSQHTLPIVDALLGISFLVMAFAPPGAFGVADATRNMQVLYAGGIAVPAVLFATSSVFGFVWEHRCREAKSAYAAFRSEKKKDPEGRLAEPRDGFDKPKPLLLPTAPAAKQSQTKDRAPNHNARNAHKARKTNPPPEPVPDEEPVD